MTPALVTELKRLEREATPGVWATLQPPFCRGEDAGMTIYNHWDPHKGQVVAECGLTYEWVEGEPDGTIQNRADAQLIVALRNVAPALLEAVETMHAALEETQEDYGQCGSLIECQDKLIWRCQYCKIGDVLARVAALLGEGREK